MLPYNILILPDTDGQSVRIHHFNMLKGLSFCYLERLPVSESFGTTVGYNNLRCLQGSRSILSHFFSCCIAPFTVMSRNTCQNCPVGKTLTRALVFMYKLSHHQLRFTQLNLENACIMCGDRMCK